MKIGIFGDAHDHLDNVRHAVSEFNRQQCELVLFAGDLVSPMVVPPLRRLKCPFVGCFGDNDGNKIGIQGGMKIVGIMGEPPFCIQTKDGTRVLLTHQQEHVHGMIEGCNVVISCHTHRPKVLHDESGTLFINPGETSGWSFRKPSVVIMETQPRSAEIVYLPAMPPAPKILV